MEEDPQLRKGVAEIGSFEKDYFKLEDLKACEELESLAASQEIGWRGKSATSSGGT